MGLRQLLPPRRDCLVRSHGYRVQIEDRCLAERRGSAINLNSGIPGAAPPRGIDREAASGWRFRGGVEGARATAHGHIGTYTVYRILSPRPTSYLRRETEVSFPNVALLASGGDASSPKAGSLRAEESGFHSAPWDQANREQSEPVCTWPIAVSRSCPPEYGAVASDVAANGF
jgi:hypothetical protein